MLALVVAACSDGPASPDLEQEQFSYVAYDLEGTAILEGEVELHNTDSDTVTGSWEIDWVEGADRTQTVGPQIGQGTLLGRRSDAEIIIDLNPGNADFNVVLFGDWTGRRISGRWEFTGIAGPMYQGTFVLRGTG
jgi:hypothetical protein